MVNRWAAVMVTGMAALGASPAAAAVCDERQPPTRAERFERQVKAGQEFRRDYGMPASRRRVVRVIRGPHKRLFGYVALSSREKRYMLRRTDTYGPAWNRLNRFTRQHRLTFGGFSVGNDYPRGPAAVLRFTRHVRQRAREARKLAPFPVRVRKVAHSERRLRRAQNGVDFDALSDEGIAIQSAYVAVDRNRVLLEVISDRPDAVERVERRFGPLFIAKVIARHPTRLVCVRPRRVKVSADGRHLTLRYETNSAYDFERVFVEEGADRVRVGIVERAPNGAVTLVAQTRTAKAVLSEPLGDRRLVYAGNGKAITAR